METPALPRPAAASSALAPQAPDRTAHDAQLRDAQLKEQAREFEAVFVSQMLKHTGLTEALSGEGEKFGGEAFASMLTDQFAADLVEDGGFGLAEEIYQQLLEKDRSHGSGDAY